MTIELPKNAPMSEYQRYIHALETMHGWLDVDLIHNCFLMGEEVGELFKAIRKHRRLFEPAKTPEDAAHPLPPADAESTRAAVAEELVDVMNYVMALANRLDIDLEEAFRKKNAYNQTRTWHG